MFPSLLILDRDEVYLDGFSKVLFMFALQTKITNHGLHEILTS